MSSEVCGLCGEDSTPWEYLPNIGHVCQDCGANPSESLRFERHFRKCWEYIIDGNDCADVAAKPEACEQCLMYVEQCLTYVEGLDHEEALETD